MVCRCLTIDAGFAKCEALEAFDELPLASPKTLWEAKTREDWESEYSAYCAGQENEIRTLGMLTDAHMQSDDPLKLRLLDYWHSRADNLGSLLSIAASIT